MYRILLRFINTNDEQILLDTGGVSVTGTNRGDDSKDNTTKDIAQSREDSDENENVKVEEPVSNEDDMKKSRKRHLTTEAREYIDSHMDMMNATDIAKELNIPYHSVYQYIKQHKKYGEVNADATSSLSAEDVGKCIALRRAGWGIKYISEELGCENKDVEEALMLNGM